MMTKSNINRRYDEVIVTICLASLLLAATTGQFAWLVTGLGLFVVGLSLGLGERCTHGQLVLMIAVGGIVGLSVFVLSQ